MNTKQEMDLLAAFRLMETPDRMMMLNLAQSLSAKSLAAKPELRLIRGGLHVPLRREFFRSGS